MQEPRKGYVQLRSKDSAYFIDEMSYGKELPSYKWSDLGTNEWTLTSEKNHKELKQIDY